MACETLGEFKEGGRVWERLSEGGGPVRQSVRAATCD